ncbi:type II secretion system protein [Candidatus Atribacteria bacterium MT.SAG.1]|nr:type II secretion system protein [Candidatus Atribacteria bacterium MT.SAG.1]
MFKLYNLDREDVTSSLSLKYMKKGFTLIELLVVIAIIGILASVVLVGFPNATRKAKDSRVISGIGQARTVMIYIGANEGTYTSFKGTHEDMVSLWTEITNNDKEETTPGIQGGTQDQGACIYAQLSAKDNYWYCAASNGLAGFTDTSPSGSGYCDGTTFVCPTVTG